jgi:hypothetical protein
MKASAVVVSVLLGMLASEPGTAQVRKLERAPLRSVPSAPEGTVPLRCRGGAVRDIGFQQFGPNNSRLTIGFKRGSKPASQGLNPGECSWVDRGMKDSEPQAICQEVNDIFLSTTYDQNAQYNPPDLYLLQSAWSNSAPYLKHIRESNFQFTVQVKSEGSCLIAAPERASAPMERRP